MLRTMQRIRQFVVADLALPFPERCDVFDTEADGNPDCNVADVFMVARVLAGDLTAPQMVCEAYIPP